MLPAKSIHFLPIRLVHRVSEVDRFTNYDNGILASWELYLIRKVILFQSVMIAVDTDQSPWVLLQSSY